MHNIGYVRSRHSEGVTKSFNQAGFVDCLVDFLIGTDETRGGIGSFGMGLEALDTGGIVDVGWGVLDSGGKGVFGLTYFVSSKGEVSKVG